MDNTQDNFIKHKGVIKDATGRELGKGDICWYLNVGRGSVDVREEIIVDRTPKMVTTIEVGKGQKYTKIPFDFTTIRNGDYRPYHDWARRHTLGNKGSGSRLILKEKANA